MKCYIKTKKCLNVLHEEVPLLPAIEQHVQVFFRNLIVRFLGSKQRMSFRDSNPSSHVLETPFSILLKNLKKCFQNSNNFAKCFV